VIYINTNLKILADLHDHFTIEQAMDSVGCWGVLADDAGLDWETSPNHDEGDCMLMLTKHHTVIRGLVAYTKPEEADIANKIADAMSAALSGPTKGTAKLKIVTGDHPTDIVAIKATCSECDHTTILSHDDWSAIVCQGCKAELTQAGPQ